MGAYHSCESVQHALVHTPENCHVCNLAELPLIFGTQYACRDNSTPFEWELS
jgi:hypothetical protein